MGGRGCAHRAAPGGGGGLRAGAGPPVWGWTAVQGLAGELRAHTGRGSARGGR
jgi:hypothetical protein